MVGFALSLGAFLLTALGLGMAFSQSLSGPPPAVSGAAPGRGPARAASLLTDGGALLLAAVLALFVRDERPEIWFVLTALAFLIGAIFWSWLTRPRHNKSGSVALSAQAAPGPAGWIGFGARLVAFAALASFALLTRPPCPPCAGG